ncbi:hypothetical protein J7K05_02250 [bacterium]|nr:hypothetical protein [bacterium]
MSSSDLKVFSFIEKRARRWWHLGFKVLRFLFFSLPSGRTLSYFWHLFRGQLSIKINGFSLELDPKDRGLSRDFFLYGNYEIYSSAYLWKKLDSKKIILDAGSSFVFTLY